MRSKRDFDGTVMVVILVTIAMHGLARAWARKELAAGTGGAKGTLAGTVELAS